MQTAGLAGASVLIVEDESLLRKQVASVLEKLGADATGAGTLGAARGLLKQLSFDYVLLDVNLPDGAGTDLLRERQFSPSTGVIVMTAHGGVEGAVEAMRLGALDYLTKPFDPDELPLVIRRAQRSRQSTRLDEHRRSTPEHAVDSFFFGESLAALETQLNKILAADLRVRDYLPPILIHGETGTGKTTIARWLHHRGPRSDQPLVEVNCSALPDTLAESELFGHERGAFTDARSTRMGLFEAASGGTLFLDELPSLSPALQAKVLTAIEDHRIRRIGSNKSILVDVRVIAATHRDLQQAVVSGTFREDLLQRLDLYRLLIPPLRERGEDIVRIAELLNEQLCLRHRLPIRRITEQGRQQLSRYRWPGNVRELAHELERGIVFEDSPELSFAHLSSPSEANRQSSESDGWFNPGFRFPAQGFSLEDAINRLINHALGQTNNNVSAAARLLGVSRDYVRYRINPNKGTEEHRQG